MPEVVWQQHGIPTRLEARWREHESERVDRSLRGARLDDEQAHGSRPLLVDE
jgi:hypothetical protein